MVFPRLKGPQLLIQNENDRAEILAALACVDYYTVIFTEDTPFESIRDLQPQILIKGGDWKPDAIVGSDLVRAAGGKVLSLNFVDGHSITKIIDKIDKK